MAYIVNAHLRHPMPNWCCTHIVPHQTDGAPFFAVPHLTSVTSSKTWNTPSSSDNTPRAWPSNPTACQGDDDIRPINGIKSTQVGLSGRRTSQYGPNTSQTLKADQDSRMRPLQIAYLLAASVVIIVNKKTTAEPPLGAKWWTTKNRVYHTACRLRIGMEHIYAYELKTDSGWSITKCTTSQRSHTSQY